MAFTMELHPTAVLFLAPVCSSLGLKFAWMFPHGYVVCKTIFCIPGFVWINRSTSRRNILQPLGNVDLPHVSDGNVLVCRIVILILMTVARGGSVLLEQPASSIMIHHPRLVWLMRRIKVSTCETLC